jgi:hypothetical protein
MTRSRRAICRYRIDLPALGYEVTAHVPSEKATHVVLAKRP